jgi:hypothetical protein
MVPPLAAATFSCRRFNTGRLLLAPFRPMPVIVRISAIGQGTDNIDHREELLLLVPGVAHWLRALGGIETCGAGYGGGIYVGRVVSGQGPSEEIEHGTA